MSTDGMNHSCDVTKEKLISDFKTLVRDAEELLKATASDLGGKATVARQKIEESLRDAKGRLANAETLVLDRTKQAADMTDAYVRENPWTSISIAAGVGLLVGLVVGRR